MLSRIFVPAILLIIAGSLNGCKSNQLAAVAESPVNPTHDFVPIPFAPGRQNPFLLIGLKAYLGQEQTAKSDAPLLELVSRDKPLKITDARGLIHKSSKILIGWENVSLKDIQYFERKVVGPFASFESANRLALRLRKSGHQALVAYPKEWEVWLPSDTLLPKGINSRLVRKVIKSKIKPVLQDYNGKHILSGPIVIEAVDGMKWQGGVYSGPFYLKKDAYGTWTLIEKVHIDRYLGGVIAHEIGKNSPQEALSAQAVLARTWALANSSRFSIDGYHLCSNTQCQVYKDPNNVSKEVVNAIVNTSGKILTWDRKPIHAVYHANNGGVMANLNEAWSIKDRPYIKAKLDGNANWRSKYSLPITQEKLRLILQSSDGAFGKYHSMFRWTKQYKALELKKYLRLLRPNLSTPNVINVVSRGPSGRVLSMEIGFEGSQVPLILERDQIRRIIKFLPSTLFIVNSLDKEIWEFKGGGFGHGVGLSQSGAIDLANKGWDFRKILAHYYPGSVYESLPDS